MDKDELAQTGHVSRFKPLSLNRLYLKIGSAIGGLILLGGIFYSGFIIGKGSIKNLTDYPIANLNQDSPSNKQIPQQPVNQQSTTSYINQIGRIYPSLNRNFSFYIYPTDNRDECLYGIRDKQGYGYDIREILGTDRITCSEGQGNLSSSFVGWADGNKFLIDEKGGNKDSRCGKARS